MTLKPACKSFVSVLVIFNISCMVGCRPLEPEPTPTATATSTATKTPVPTATATLTPEPSPSAAVPSVPTSSVKSQSALSMSSDCRFVIDGLINLKKEIGLPEHLMSENPFRQASDFDPNQYFQVLTHLKVASGYKLDYVYFNDELGGLPLVYARESSSAPFRSYSELLESFGEEITGEYSYGELKHKYDYLEKIQIDRTPESYFEFTTLAFLGDQFYLWWHGLYNDSKILCEISDKQYVYNDMQGFNLEFPQDAEDMIEMIDFNPVVVVDENTVTVRFVTFTKWGGFFENVYVMDRDNPMYLIDVKFNPLIEYDCGIDF